MCETLIGTCIFALIFECNSKLKCARGSSKRGNWILQEGRKSLARAPPPPPMFPPRRRLIISLAKVECVDAHCHMLDNAIFLACLSLSNLSSESINRNISLAEVHSVVFLSLSVQVYASLLSSPCFVRLSFSLSLSRLHTPASCVAFELLFHTRRRRKQSQSVGIPRARPYAPLITRH